MKGVQRIRAPKPPTLGLDVALSLVKETYKGNAACSNQIFKRNWKLGRIFGLLGHSRRWKMLTHVGLVQTGAQMQM